MRAHLALALLSIPTFLSAQPLPGVEPLTASGDPVAEMVQGIGRYLDRIGPWFTARRDPDPHHLPRIIGAVDPRVEAPAMHLVATTAESAVLAATDSFEVLSVRWPALEGVHGEGLYLRQFAPARFLVIYLPEPDRLPEQCPEIFEFAAAGADVLVPVLLRRGSPPPPAPAARRRPTPRHCATPGCARR